MFEAFDKNYPNLDDILSVLEIYKWKTADRVLEILLQRNSDEYTPKYGTYWHLLYQDPLIYTQKRLLANKDVRQKEVSSMSGMENILLERSHFSGNQINILDDIAFKKNSSDGNKTLVGRLGLGNTKGLAFT